MSVISSNLSNSDVDECAASPGPCDAVNGGCMNSPAGSYTCTCNSGYELNADGSTCDGMIQRLSSYHCVILH